jgi:predicted 2-oxoglutarate/Fe(II)-dependent dioxygenase YbiX
VNGATGTRRRTPAPDVYGLPLEDGTIAVDLWARANGAADAYDLTVVDIDTWHRSNDVTDRLHGQHNGPWIPGTTARPLGDYTPNDFPPPFSGAPDDLCSVIRWYEPPHPLALTDELCDLALEHTEWTGGKPDDDHQADVGGIGTITEETTPLYWSILSAAQALNQFGARLEWDPPNGFTMLRYRPGHALGWHTDSYANSPDSEVSGFMLSAIVQLSDPSDYEGGAVLFGDAPGEPTLELPRTRGTIAVFPSDTWHHVAPLTAGTRYSMTVFFPGVDGLTEDRLD